MGHAKANHGPGSPRKRGPAGNAACPRLGRTRRDAKTFSFLEVNDGSCLRNLQVMRRQALGNYAEVQHIITGASVVRAREAGGLPGAGAEVGAKRRGSDDCRPLGCRLSASEEGAHPGIPAGDRPPPPALEPFRRRLPDAEPPRVRRPQVLQREGVRLPARPDHHRERLRGGGGDVPGDDARPRGPAEDARTAPSTTRRTSSGARRT